MCIKSGVIRKVKDVFRRAQVQYNGTIQMLENFGRVDSSTQKMGRRLLALSLLSSWLVGRVAFFVSLGTVARVYAHVLSLVNRRRSLALFLDACKRVS